MRAISKNSWFDLFNRQEIFVFILLLVVIIFLSLTTTTFLTANNLQNVSRNFAWIAIPAFGESLVIIIGGIDLSVGSVMALSGLVTAMVLQSGMPNLLAVIAGLAAGKFNRMDQRDTRRSCSLSAFYRHAGNV